MLTPEGEIFIIPARLEECNYLESLKRFHGVDLFEERGYEYLMRALRLRAEKIGAVLQSKRSWLPNITIPRATSRKSAEIKKPESVKKKQAETPREIPSNKIQQKSETPPPANNFPEGWETEWLPALEWEKSSTKQESTEKLESKSAITKKTPRKWNTLIVVAAVIIGFPILMTLFTNWTWNQWFAPNLITVTPSQLTLTKTSSTLTFTPALPTKTETPTYTPTKKLQSTEITDDKGVQMALVPASNFIMGSKENIQTIYVDSFYVDKYEVTNMLYKECIRDKKCEGPTDTKIGKVNYFNDEVYNNYPVVWVTQSMARKFCEWRGARLPTGKEWEKAARGTDGRVYPWGNETDVELRANGPGSKDGFQLTAPVGSFSSGVSPYGAFDMAGNVSELIDDYDHQSWDSVEYPIYRGGSWLYRGPDETLEVTSWGLASNWYTSHSEMGFRCARGANP